MRIVEVEDTSSEYLYWEGKDVERKGKRGKEIVTILNTRQ